ncbi:MAG TPA: YiiD C-terminal domain-containing protein [Rudaea sp.]|nr:YiiD C-terminal domain-containing protein [Rudaea sp.]
MSDAIRTLEAAILAQIPLARAMQLRLRDYDGDHLTIAAPLAPNINDKGCAFGGSLVSLLTLAGWGLIVLKLRALGSACDVYVQDSAVRYLAPVWDDFTVQARLAEGESWETFTAALAARSRARVSVDCRVPLADGADACTLQARFVAISKP